MIVPAILKVRYGAHVVQQMVSFKELCHYIEDHNTPPTQLSIQGIQYDPNALGHSDKILFYRKCFRHRIVTYGTGRFELINGKGEIESEGDVFAREEDKKTFRRFTGSEPYGEK